MRQARHLAQHLGLALGLLSTVGCVHFPPAMTLVTIEPEDPQIVIHDVTVFAATSTHADPHQDVVVHAGRIQSVGPSLPVATYAGARVIEGAGQTLLPGLVDVHAHPTGTGSPFYRLEVPDPKRNLQAHLYVGVTTIDDPGGDPKELAQLAQEIEQGTIPGPRLFYAGRIITARNGYPPAMLSALMPWPLAGIAIDGFAAQVSNAEEARAAVRANIEAGASFIKVAVTQLPNAQTPRLDAEEIAAVVDEAHAHHLKVVAHVDAVDDALLCARNGVDALWHNVQLDLLTPEQTAELASHLHIVAPTLTTFDGFDSLYEGSVVPSPLLRATESPGLVQSLVEAPKHIQEIPPSLRVWMERLHANHAGRRANAKALHDAGMTILIGTDGNGADGAFPANYPAELVALHEAGIDNAELLLGATVRGAQFLDPHPEFGTIEPGKIADLVLVEGDPLADIGAVAHVALVMARGRVLTRHPGPAR